MQLAARIQQVPPSVTLAIAAKAKEMKAAGVDVCSFSAGEPDFDTPDYIKAAAKRALDRGKTRYGPAAGEPQLREAIANKLRQENQLDYHSDNVIVTNGGKHSLYNLMMALIEPGDEAIVPSPYWLSYPEMVKLAGGTPVFVETSREWGYKMTPQQLKQAITPQTKLFILNSPANPTGAVYSPGEIRALAEVVVESDIWVVSDEIYEKIRYDGVEHLSIGAIAPEVLARTITSNGFAKSFSMTGWRVGYAAGPVELINAMTKLQSHSTSNICTFAQFGAIAALEEPSTCVEEMLTAFAVRRRVMLEAVQSIAGLRCPVPQGAFYVFIDIGETGLKSVEFCDRLLEAYQVAAIPGVAFGEDNCIRLSYATDLTAVEKGMERLDKFVSSLLAG